MNQLTPLRVAPESDSDTEQPGGRSSFNLWLLLYRTWNWLRTQFSRIPWERVPVTALQWVMIAYVVLAALFIVYTPPLEAGLESAYAARMLQTVPDVDQAVLATKIDQVVDIDWQQFIAAEPALYFQAGSVVLSMFDVAPAVNQLQINPYLATGRVDLASNKNLFLPRDASDDLPLAIGVLRALNVLIGIATIFVVARTVRILTPFRPYTYLIAAGITALNPQFLFLSASASNIPLAILANALVIWAVVHGLRYGLSQRNSLLLVGGLILSALSSISVIAMVIPVVLALVWLGVRDRNWQLAGGLIAAVLVVGAVGLFGWIQQSSLVTNAGNSTSLWHVETVLGSFQTFRNGYWGLFGAVNISANALVYLVGDMIVFLSLGGIVFLVLQLWAISDFGYARREVFGYLFVLGVLLSAMIFYFVMRRFVDVDWGYLLFPWLAAISAVLATGLMEVVWWVMFVFSPPERNFVRAGEAVSDTSQFSAIVWLTLLFLLCVIWVPGTSVRASYAPPATVDALPSQAEPVYAQFDDIKLIGYDVIQRRYLPGDFVPVSLYWQAGRPPQDDLMLSLALVRPDGREVAKLDTIPGGGLLPSAEWEAGVIYADTYQLRVRSYVGEATRLQLAVNWWNRRTQTSLPVLNDEGDPISVLLDAGALISDSSDAMEPETPYKLENEEQLQAEFNGTVKLLDFAFDPETYGLLLQWEIVGPTDENYTVFAHLYNIRGDLISQEDVAPALPLRYRQYSEKFTTLHQLSPAEAGRVLLPGTYDVVVGWYDAAGDRLPRLNYRAPVDDTVDADGNIPGDDSSFDAVPVESDDAADDVLDFPTEYTLFRFMLNEDNQLTSERLDELLLEDNVPQLSPNAPGDSNDANSGAVNGNGDSSSAVDNDSQDTVDDTLTDGSSVDATSVDATSADNAAEN